MNIIYNLFKLIINIHNVKSQNTSVQNQGISREGVREQTKCKPEALMQVTWSFFCFHDHLQKKFRYAQEDMISI